MSLYVDPGMARIEGRELLDAAERALRRPQDFGYWGENTPETGWGWPGLVAAGGEDDALNRSNLRVIHEDLASQFPDDVTIESSKHWAVGNLDELRIRVLVDPEKPVTEDNITPAFRVLAEWAQRLAGYPVADDDDYSTLEAEEAEAAGYIYCEDDGLYQDPRDCKAAGHTHDGIPDDEE